MFQDIVVVWECELNLVQPISNDYIPRNIVVLLVSDSSNISLLLDGHLACLYMLERIECVYLVLGSIMKLRSP